MRKKRFDSTVAFKVLDRDREQLQKLATQLGLEESEIARRALRVGLNSGPDSLLDSKQQGGGTQGRGNP